MAETIGIIAALVVLSTSDMTLHAQPLAFPGAEGWGKYTVGGRVGAVYEVTTLEDNGPGSLRYAVSQSGPRTVVFRVSGSIVLKSRLTINKPYLTIAGQTAPGDGICLRDHNLNVETHDVIIRFIRVRMGDVDTLNQEDSFTGQNCRNVIIDHCSVSWSIDETFSMYQGAENFTVQWCFITESLKRSHHVKGEHGYGGIWGGKNASWHHNLLAHHSSRNPRFDRGLENVDHRNNVIYNWEFNSCYGGEASVSRPSTINMVANYYKAGPATRSGEMQYRIANPDNEGYGYGKWFISENYVAGHPEVTADNWKYGVQGITQAVKDTIRVIQPFTNDPIYQHSPQDAYMLVLKHGGALLPKRDTIDRRIVWEVEHDTALYRGKKAGLEALGIIDSQNDVGGWPVLNSDPAPADSDHDGMPDDWERAHGLNPDNPSDGNIVDPGGYTNLELYLNSLVADGITGVAAQEGTPREFTVAVNYPNPFNSTTRLSYTLPAIGKVGVRIIDVLGRTVRAFYGSEQFPGSHTLGWDGTDDSHQAVPSGVYLCIVSFGEWNRALRMVLLR